MNHDVNQDRSDQETVVRGERRLLLSFVWALPLPDVGAVIGRGKSLNLLHALHEDMEKEWSSVERFHISDNNQRPARWLLTTENGRESPLTITSGRVHAAPCHILVSELPDCDVLSLILSINLSSRNMLVDRLAIDETISLIQSLDKGTEPDGAHDELKSLTCASLKLTCHGPRVYSSARAAAIAALGQFISFPNLSGRLRRRGWCVEIRGLDGRSPREDVETCPQPYYGLATGDEGWRFVPWELAQSCLAKPWSTRQFLAVYSVGAGVLCLNNKDENYINLQGDLGLGRFGKREPYFGINSNIAGLDHGPLLVLERVLTRLALADHRMQEAERLAQHRRLQHRRPVSSGPSDLLVTSSTSDDRAMRRVLNDSSARLSNVLLPEVDPLEQAVSRGLGLEDVISQLDRLAQAVDDDVRDIDERNAREYERIAIEYQRTVSRRLMYLTTAAILLALVEVVTAVLALTLK